MREQLQMLKAEAKKAKPTKPAKLAKSAKEAITKSMTNVKKKILSKSPTTKTTKQKT